MDQVTIFTAFAAGLISFLSPCVLPLVPGYISIISGFTLDQLKAEGEKRSIQQAVLLNSAMFIIGFSITFITLGASATWLGHILLSKAAVFYRVAGIVIVVFGLHLLGIVRINSLYRDKRFHQVPRQRGVGGALLLGLAFAFGWTPCIGPILSGVLTIASTKATVIDGIVLLMAYSLGLGIPFLITGVALNRFLQFYGRFKQHFRAVEVASGVLVTAVGLLVLTNNMSRLSALFSFMNRFAL